MLKHQAAEARQFMDPRSGVRVRQVTSHPSLHHHPFYYLPAYDDAMTRLFFVSHRTGRPEIWCEIRATGELQQLTDQPDLGEWSVHPSHDGRFVYYTAGSVACRVSCDDGTTERVADFGALAGREAGMVGAAMGTTTLSHDDRYWAVPVKIGAGFRFIVIDTSSGAQQTILEAPTIGHPEFYPSDNTLLRYAGSYKQRIWVINRDGTGNRLVYDRRPLGKPNQYEWIVHETWNPGRTRRTGSPLTPDTRHLTPEIITANWPRGCIGIDIDTGAVRPVCAFNAWHPSINRQGTLMCTDTVFPDIGLQLFNPRDGVGEPRTLCFPEATNEGRHWNTDHCPYDDEDYQQGKWKVYAPQHTHPHPAFSPDGRFVVYTSDRTGHSQVFEVELD
ncbi:MAG: TolB family protein [Kiritimatiellia bacterium]